MRRAALLAILYIGGFVSLMGAVGTWPFVGPATVAVTATPQVTMNPFAVVQGNAGGNPIDMGPTPDANFVAMVDWNQEPAPTGTSNYCGTTTAPNCVVYKYIDHLRNSCLTTQTLLVITDAGLPATVAPSSTPGGAAQETWFQHVYPSTPNPSPPPTPYRNVASLVTSAACQNYYASPLPTTFPTGTPLISQHPFMMNPDDAGFQNELTNRVWTNTGSNFYPQTQNATTAPMNVYEDTSGTLGIFITGAASGSILFASEYGCGFNAGKTCRNDQPGTGPFAVADAYTTALGKWANSACGSPCLKITLNGTAPEAGTLIACNIFNTPGPATDCHDKTNTGDVDNTFEKAYASVIAGNTAGNIKDFDEESPIFDHLGGGWGNTLLLNTLLNTWINFQQDAATNGVTISDLEPGWGPGGIGDTTTSVRLMSIGMEWMAPDYSGVKSSNDRIIPRRLPIGLSTTESPSFFELFMVPFAPLQQEVPYVYNSNKQVTNGGGCNGGSISNQGDSGGLTTYPNGVLVACAADGGGVYRLEYNQVWFNGHNYGPMAVLVNTSFSDTVTISSSWFQLQPFTSYGYTLTLAGSEMESVAQGNIGGGVANFTTCTNVTYCATGNNTMAQNTTAGRPTTIAPHSAVILVTTNS